MAEIDYAKVNEVAESYRADMTALPAGPDPEQGHELPGRGQVRASSSPRWTSWATTAPASTASAAPSATWATVRKLICFDGHIDTVGVGNIDNWKFDPFEGFEDDELIGGRGGSDQLGGVVSAVYGGKIAKDLGLLDDQYTYMVTGTVQEEDCDGMCWLYLIEEENEKPDFVISTEPTDHGIYRGHRGRMEIRVEVDGVSCHGSAPERGDNAIYKMAEILLEIRDLNDQPARRPVPRQGHRHHVRDLLHLARRAAPSPTAARSPSTVA